MTAGGSPPTTGRRRGPRRPWPKRQGLLLDELERVFREEGFAHLSVGEMASRLQASRSTLYGLAPTKEQLIRLVVSRMFVQLEKETDTALADALTTADKMTARIRCGTVLTGSPAINSDLESCPKATAIRDEYLASDRKALADLIENQEEDGASQPVPTALVMQVVDAAQARLRDPDVLKEIGMTCEQAAGYLASMLLHGIGGDSPQRAVNPVTG